VDELELFRVYLCQVSFGKHMTVILGNIILQIIT